MRGGFPASQISARDINKPPCSSPAVPARSCSLLPAAVLTPTPPRPGRARRRWPWARGSRGRRGRGGRSEGGSVRTRGEAEGPQPRAPPALPSGPAAPSPTVLRRRRAVPGPCPGGVPWPGSLARPVPAAGSVRALLPQTFPAGSLSAAEWLRNGLLSLAGNCEGTARRIEFFLAAYLVSGVFCARRELGSGGTSGGSASGLLCPRGGL